MHASSRKAASILRVLARAAGLSCLGLSLAAPARAGSGAPVVADAAERRDRDALEALLEAGADATARQADGMTALHWAAWHDDTEMARCLLRSGAAADAENRYGVRPLSLACRNGNGELVELLLEAGADPQAASRGGETPLMTASRTGRPGPVEALLSRDVEVDAKERSGQTALMWAAAEGHAEVVRRLVEAGARLDARSRSGFTAWFFAARQGHIDVIDALLAAGVDVGEVKRRGRPSKENEREEGKTALLLAVENAHFELASRLLEAGADPNDERSGLTPLHAIPATRKTGRGDGADGNPPPAGSGSVTSLQLVEKLVEHGADVDRRLARGSSGRGVLSLRGATPFLLAARNGDIPLMRKLLELGADPSIPNAEGSTPLLAAAGLGTLAPGEEAGSEEEALEALRLLLALASDIDAVGESGETAMHAAAYKNAPRVIELLAKEGASMDVWNRENAHGWTPLAIAEGHRPGNFKPSPATVAAFHRVFRAAGVPVPAPRLRGKDREDY